MDVLLLAAKSSGNDAAAVAVLLGLMALVIGYFIPTIVAIIRRPIDMGTAIVLNLFLGWTFVFWVWSLALAFGSRHVKVKVDHRFTDGYQVPPGYWVPPTPPGQPVRDAAGTDPDPRPNPPSSASGRY